MKSLDFDLERESCYFLLFFLKFSFFIFLFLK
jgi:hypothetical protein